MISRFLAVFFGLCGVLVIINGILLDTNSAIHQIYVMTNYILGVLLFILARITPVK